MEETSTRAVRRHERTYSQATNIFTGIVSEEKEESPKLTSDDPNGVPHIEDNVKPYSERKQFWESVSSMSSDSKRSSIIKSETESDTDTGTEGTVVEKNLEIKVKNKTLDNTQAENEKIGKISSDFHFYENSGFTGSQNIDITEVSERSTSYEVRRSDVDFQDLPSPEDISLKDVKTKRDIFEQEIKRQSLEYEESIGKKSSKHNSSDDSSSESRDLPRDEAIQAVRVKCIPVEGDEKEIAKQVGKFNEEVKLRKLHTLPMFDKGSSLSTSSEKSDSLTGSIDRSSDIYSSSIDKSSSRPNSSSSDFKSSTIASSVEADGSEDDMTRTEESSGDETTTTANTSLAADRKSNKEAIPENADVSHTEERRYRGDLEETIVRETTTTRSGRQEQRIIKETKTQETQLADGSTVKSTSITTFTTQLDSQSDEDDIRDNKKMQRDESQERQQSVLEQRVKTDIFKEEITSLADEQSPEHKILSPTETDFLPVLSRSIAPILSSPIHVPEENIQDIVWEVSQERSEIPDSETVEYMPEQRLPEEILGLNDKDERIKGNVVENFEIKLSEDQARKIAIEIVEQAKSEALKRSPSSTPSKVTTTMEMTPAIPSESSDSSFSEKSTQQIDKFIIQQLEEQVDGTQKVLMESVASRKSEILRQKLSTYKHSEEMTDEDLRSSGAELSSTELQMDRLRQMTEDDDTLRSFKEPSEADESEGSMIIHESLDDSITNQYDQATQMISKTLDNIQSVNLKGERVISTISEEASETESKITGNVQKTEDMTDETSKDVKIVRIDRSLIKEDERSEYGILERLSISSEEKTKDTNSSKSAVSGRDYIREENKSEIDTTISESKVITEKHILIKDEIQSEVSLASAATIPEKYDSKHTYEIYDQEAYRPPQLNLGRHDIKDSVIVLHQKSLDLHKEQHMESSMTESMEESSTAESTKAYEPRIVSEMSKSVITEIKEIDENMIEKHPEVVMRIKKLSVDELKKNVQEIDTGSSSGESHYFTAEGASDSHTGSRPCSSDVEALLSGTTGTTGTSEYETALSSQETSHKSQYSSTSAEYQTAASSISSRDSMKSIDSESSGHLGSIELSEASETLVPSSLELERDMEVLDQEILEEELRRSQHSHNIIPQLTIQSETPKTEDSPSCFEIDSDEMDDSEIKDEVADTTHIASKMKRSIEMTFHPDLQQLSDAASNETSIDAITIPPSDDFEMVEKSITECSMPNVDQSVIMEASDKISVSSSVDSKIQSSKPEVKSSVSIASQDQREITNKSIDRESVQSVTITATSVPSIEGKATASMCTQVTSEIKNEDKSVKTDSVFLIKGPTEDEEVAEIKIVTDSRPVVAPDVLKYSLGASAGPSEGPARKQEYDETEADQEYSRIHEHTKREESIETELQYSIDECDDVDDSKDSLLDIIEPHERPKTPEPGNEPPISTFKVSVSSLEDPDDMTEVDQRFSEVFSMTYEDRDEDNGVDTSVPNITITEHMAPMEQQYPDLEKDEDFPECRGSSLTSSLSSVTSPKSTTTDSDQGREYCLDSNMKEIGSFEMIEFEDIIDISEFEQTMVLHEERVREITQIKEEDEEIFIENGHQSSPLVSIPHTIKAVKLDTTSDNNSKSQSGEPDEQSNEQYESSIEEQRRWLEMQFENGTEATPQDYSPPKFMDHVYSGPLEDIEEEREDMERRDLTHVVKGSSLSSTPEYDVLAGRKFFTRSGDHDDASMCSLQEFERLEREMALENAARRSSSGSQESLNGKRPVSKGSQGDDVSIASLNSLNEFENLETQCVSADIIEKKALEEVAMLSEIEEGHESQVSEAESCETISDDDDENYANRMFQIDEIIRQAQNNVEKFEGASTTSYQGVRLKDIVSVDGSTVSSDKSPSVGMPDDPDSLEEPAKSTLPTTSAAGNVKCTSQDSLDKLKTLDRMTTSADSLEFNSVKDPMKTSVDSLEFRKKRDTMTVSTDSIDLSRHDVMATSIDSLGRDDSSGREGDISSVSDMISRPNGAGMMEWSTDSLEPSSSLATHATYHDNDSVMSSSFASGCSNTLIGSMEECGDFMAASIYIPEGELPSEEVQEQYSRLMKSGEAITSEVVAPSTEAGFSHTVSRSVALPPQIRQVKFTGSDAQQKMEEYMQEFNEGDHVTEEENVDDMGNVHVQKVIQRRIIVAPEETKEFGFTLSDPSTEETVTKDQYGNVTRVIKRTVVTTHTVEHSPNTGEMISELGSEDTMPALVTQAQAGSSSVMPSSPTDEVLSKSSPVYSRVTTCEVTTKSDITASSSDDKETSGGQPGRLAFFLRPVSYDTFLKY